MSDATTLQPFLFTPLFKEKIWGGQSLATRLGKSIPADVAVGESWEISGFNGDLTTVVPPGPPGATITDLLGSMGQKLVGSQVALDAFPLLYKFIDAHDKLSVQVHPDDLQAKANGWGEFGKTEAWYVVDAVAGAQLIMGFKKGVTPGDVTRAIEHSNLESLLNYVDVHAGDVLFIPAGAVHAILSGTLLYEVQQSSDTTLRLYDWGRVDTAGRPRQLHVDESMKVLDTTWHERHKIPPVVCEDFLPCRHQVRVACRYFALEEFLFDAAQTIELPARKSFSVVTLLNGAAQISWNKGQLAVQKGHSVLIPAALHHVRFEASAKTNALISWVPDLRAEIINPLRRLGMSDERIELLGGYAGKNDILPLMK